LKTSAKELAEYKLNLVGAQKFRWDNSGAEPACDYTFFYQNISN
jgi:hypothetical protein